MSEQHINSSGYNKGDVRQVLRSMAELNAQKQEFQEQLALLGLRENIQKILTGKDGEPIKPESLTAEEFIQYEIMMDECKKLEAKIELQKQQNEAKAEVQRELKMNREPSEYELEKMMAGEKNDEKSAGMATALARMQKLSAQKAEIDELIKNTTSDTERTRLETLRGILENELNETKKAETDGIKDYKPNFDK